MKYLKIFLLILIVGLVLFIGIKNFNFKAESLCDNCNLIIISATDLRNDRISSSGYFRQTTPNLDKLASKSLVFNNFFSHASWTLPTSLSLFSSTFPFQHGVMNRYDGTKLSKNTPTLTDILNNHGYKTAAFTGGSDYFPRYGLTERFETHEECTKVGNPMEYIPPVLYGEFGCTIPKALNWLKKNSSKKFFLFLQGYDIHCPYAKHALNIYDKNYKGNIDFTSCIWTFDSVKPIVKDGKTVYPVYISREIEKGKEIVYIDDNDVNHLKALYDEQVTATDKLLGNFLTEIGKMNLDKKTVIVFTSEHGDIFGKHGRFMRGGRLHGTFYDDVLHVPFWIKLPKVTSKRIDALAQQIDIMPTILDILGLKSQKKMEGKSLIPTLNGKEVNDFVFAGTEFIPEATNLYYNKRTIIESIRDKNWKLIQETGLDEKPPTVKMELYNIKNDREEQTNLVDFRKDVLDVLQRKLNEWSTKIRK